MLALNAYTLIKSIHRLNSKHPKLATFIDKKSDNFPHISPEAVEVPIEGSALDRIRQKHAEQEIVGQASQ